MSVQQASFEKNLERLQQIVDQLESGELPLEQGVALYKEGQALAGACRGQLSEARLVVSLATQDSLTAFNATESEEN